MKSAGPVARARRDEGPAGAGPVGTRDRPVGHRILAEMFFTPGRSTRPCDVSVRSGQPRLLALAMVGAACTSKSSDGGERRRGTQQRPPRIVRCVTLSDQLKITPAMIDAPADTPLDVRVIERRAHAQHTLRCRSQRPDLRDGPDRRRRRPATLEVPALPEGGLHDAVHRARTRGCRHEGHADGVGERHDASERAGTTPGRERVAGHSTMTAQQMADAHAKGVQRLRRAAHGRPEHARARRPAAQARDGRRRQGLQPDGVPVTAGRSRRAGRRCAWRSTDKCPGRDPGQRGDNVGSSCRTRWISRSSCTSTGLTVPNDMDGVPYVTQDPIMPGKSWTYEFTDQGPTRDVRVPLALQLRGAGRRRPLRRAHRRAEADWLEARVYGVGAAGRGVPRVPRRRPARLHTSTASGSRRRCRSSRSTAIGS